MKQHITKEQWDELSDEEKVLFLDVIVPNFRELHKSEYLHPSIGQLIEFLGDDLDEISILSEDNLYFITTNYVVGKMYKSFEREELIDALWEAVKYKLNNKPQTK